MSYDPTIGRFVSEDPIAFDGEDADLYRYVGNDPTNEIDPTGLQASPAKPAPPIPTPPYFNPKDPGDYLRPGYLVVSPKFKSCGGTWSWIPEYDVNNPKNPFPLPKPGTTSNYADALQTPAGVLKIPAGVTVTLVGCTPDGRPTFYSDGETIWYSKAGGGANPFGDNPNTTQTEPWGGTGTPIKAAPM